MKNLRKACLFLLAGGMIFLVSACNSNDLKTSTLLADEATCPGAYHWENNNKICDDPNATSGTSGGDQSQYQDQYQYQPQEDRQNMQPQENYNQKNYKQDYQQNQNNSWNNFNNQNPQNSQNPQNQYMQPMQDNGQQDGQQNQYMQPMQDNGMNNKPMNGPQNDCFSAENKACHDKAISADLRDIERMKREITKYLKTSKDTATLNGYLTRLDELKTALIDATTQEEVDTTRQEIQGTIGNALQSYRCANDLTRMEKETKMRKQDFDRSRKHLKEVKVSGDWDAKIQEQLARLDKLEKLQNQLLEAMKSCSQDTMETMDSIRWEMEDVQMAADEFWFSFDSIQNTLWAGQMFDQVEQQIDFFYKNGYSKLTPDMQKKADEIFAIAKQLVASGRQAVKDNNTELIKKNQQKLEELGRSSNQLFGRPDTNFQELGYTKEFDKKFDTVSQNMNYDQKVQMVKDILATNPEIIEKILKGDPALAEKTLKIFGRVPENMKSDYLSGKADLESVYNEILTVNKGIAAYKEDILGYNYFGKALEEMVTALKEVRDGTITVDEFVSRLDTWKDASKQEKYQAGVVSFKDYDDSDWYYDSVEGMKDFLKGKETKDGMAFAGNDQITFAETLKIVMERFGKGQNDGTPSNVKAQNHWAKGYYVAAEAMGITLLDPNHLITRGEMARLIVEATLKTPTSHSTSDFSDLTPANPYFDYLETLKDYGVISGDSTSSGIPTVRPNSTINRAETAKVVNSAFNEFQLQTLDVNELNSMIK